MAASSFRRTESEPRRSFVLSRDVSSKPNVSALCKLADDGVCFSGHSFIFQWFKRCLAVSLTSFSDLALPAEANASGPGSHVDIYRTINGASCLEFSEIACHRVAYLPSLRKLIIVPKQNISIVGLFYGWDVNNMTHF